MDSKTLKFLQAVLGNDGAKALVKAADRSQELGNVLLPRTAVAWLSIATLHDFEGEIPGVSNTYLQFKKSEDGFTGNVYIGETDYQFENQSMYHLAAAMVCALGADSASLTDSVQSPKLADLGRSIDLIVKSRIATKKLMEKKLSKGDVIGRIGNPAGAAPQPVSTEQLLDRHVSSRCLDDEGDQEAVKAHLVQHHGLSPQVAHALVHAHEHLGLDDEGDRNAFATAIDRAKSFKKEELEKKGGAGGGTEGKGAAAAPIGPTPPAAPTPTAPKPTAAPKLPKAKAPGAPTAAAAGSTAPASTSTAGKGPASTKPSIKIGKSQASTKCPACLQTQFKGQAFVGCYCMRSLAKAVKVTKEGDGYRLDLGASFDEDAIETLIECLAGDDADL